MSTGILCSVSLAHNFFITWAVLTVLGYVTILVLSGIAFRKYYMNVKYETWIWKSNAKFPPPSKVRDEILLMTKGIWSATFCPTLTLYLMQWNVSEGYCGVHQEYGWSYEILNFFVVWLLSDFFEFFYHRLGHKYQSMWKIHKYHHQFFNPTPFAVISDEFVDQFIRAAALVAFPLIWPVNMDMMFFQYLAFFYTYGVYLHWGYELPWLSAHNPVVNTAFQHYLHHAISAKQNPLHTGFMFKIWDQLFGSVYTGDCFCAECEQKKGNRTRQAFEKVQIPDYSVLWKDLSLWKEGIQEQWFGSRVKTA